jgi:hypothetical protein
MHVQSSSSTQASCHLTLEVGERSLENAVRVGTPPSSGTSKETRCRFHSRAPRAIRDVTAGSGKRCGSANPEPRVMPTPMPIGSRSQSVAVGPMGRSVFGGRFQTVPARLRTLSGNAVGGETRHDGSNPSRSVLLIRDKGLRVRLQPQHGGLAEPFWVAHANGDANRCQSVSASSRAEIRARPEHTRSAHHHLQHEPYGHLRRRGAGGVTAYLGGRWLPISS